MLRISKKALIMAPVGALSIALAISAYYNSLVSLPPSHLIGIIYLKEDVDTFDQNGNPEYFLHTCIFVDDIQNDVNAGECRSYEVDKNDYESVKNNDIVRATVMSGQQRGMDIYETFEGNGRYISDR
jgi:hypothetical protein